MRIVRSPYTVYCPVRVNLLGGWTDQLLWRETASVVNMAIGWHGKRCYNGYPLMLDSLGRFHSAVSGRGTGLGISSIRAAMMYLQSFPESIRRTDYVRFVLEYEKAMLGTEGGWQDQIGGVSPGFKIVTTPGEDRDRHKRFCIERCDDHSVIDRIVLFDTKVRRESGAIGDSVRHLMISDKAFKAHLRDVAKLAQKCFFGDADEMIRACNYSWNTFCEFVPQMKNPKPLPKTNMIVGNMLVGAGGGGYGLAFTDCPESRPEVVELLQGAGFWATIPVLLPGIKFTPANE